MSNTGQENQVDYGSIIKVLELQLDIMKVAVQTNDQDNFNKARGIISYLNGDLLDNLTPVAKEAPEEEVVEKPKSGGKKK